MGRVLTGGRRGWRALVVVLVAAGGVVGSAPPAGAHGERSQAAFLRTQTIAFWDVRFSTTRLRVGEPLEVTGKFRVMEDWPETLALPETAFLTVVAPGPVFLVKDRQIDGRFAPQSITPHQGRVHDFRMRLLARRDGHWHVHPSLAVKKAGALIGPGQWVDVEKGDGPFRNVVALENGRQADLEHYGLSTLLTWHALWVVIGVVFVVYWLLTPRRRLISQMARIQADPENQQWSFMRDRRDIRFSVVIGLLTLGLIAAGVIYANRDWPGTIPLQVRKTNLPGVDLNGQVEARVAEPARFDATHDEMQMTIEVANREAMALSLDRFAMADLSFARQGDAVLVVDGPAVINPGETRRVAVRLRSPLWTAERLVPAKEVDVQLAGVVLFSGPGGAERVAEVSFPVFRA
jgi:methane/ammonia monooxygenase subunit B